MSSIFEGVVIVLLGVVLLALGLFFSAFPGLRYIRVQMNMRRLKKELEPVARAFGARTKTEWIADKGQAMYFFEFPNEKWVIHNPRGDDLSVSAWLALEVDENGYNVYIPSFTPPKTHPPDYKALVAAVTRLQNPGSVH